MQTKPAIIPGWALHCDEISNNVFTVTLVDQHGRQASSTEVGFETALAKAEEYTYGIEMSVNNYPNRFLFNYFLGIPGISAACANKIDFFAKDTCMSDGIEELILNLTGQDDRSFNLA